MSNAGERIAAELFRDGVSCRGPKEAAGPCDRTKIRVGIAPVQLDEEALLDVGEWRKDEATMPLVNEAARGFALATDLPHAAAVLDPRTSSSFPERLGQLIRTAKVGSRCALQAGFSRVSVATAGNGFLSLSPSREREAKAIPARESLGSVL